jgi:hypothetical protein
VRCSLVVVVSGQGITIELSREDKIGLELGEVTSDVFDRGKGSRTVSLNLLRLVTDGFHGRDGFHNG